MADKIELIEGDARETIGGLQGPFDLLFVDAMKVDYAGYLRRACRSCPTGRWWSSTTC